MEGWIWLDGVENFEKSKRVRAWKYWEKSFLFIYLIELMAQAGAILLGAETDFQDDIVFTKMEKVEFFGRPQAGTRLDVEAEAEGIQREGGWFFGQVFQKNIKIAEGRVLLMNIGRLRPDGKGPVTFPEKLLQAVKQE